MGQCAPEDSISQCPFLQMIDTAGNPHADGSAAPGARPRHRPSRHSDPPATSRSHDNWMAARQTSCRQQTAPPQPRCSKDVTAHPHRPGARPGRPCPVPARSGQPLSGRSRFSPAFGTEFFCSMPDLAEARSSWSGSPHTLKFDVHVRASFLSSYQITCTPTSPPMGLSCISRRRGCCRQVRGDGT